jgi:hypothetical protein
MSIDFVTLTCSCFSDRVGSTATAERLSSPLFPFGVTFFIRNDVQKVGADVHIRMLCARKYYTSISSDSLCRREVQHKT